MILDGFLPCLDDLFNDFLTAFNRFLIFRERHEVWVSRESVQNFNYSWNSIVKILEEVVVLLDGDSRGLKHRILEEFLS